MDSNMIANVFPKDTLGQRLVKQEGNLHIGLVPVLKILGLNPDAKYLVGF